jgi:hypothetical protein
MAQAMKHPNTHARLLGLLCLLMVAIPLALAGCGALLAPDSRGQAAEALDQIVPGMTRAEDLANMGIDLTGGETLSSAGVASRFASADPRIQACVQAGLYCTGYVVRAAASGGFLAPLLGRPKPVQVVLLVMNGRVMDKVLSADTPAPHLRVASATTF